MIGSGLVEILGHLDTLFAEGQMVDSCTRETYRKSTFTLYQEVQP